MQLEVLLGQHQRTVEELGQRLQLAQKELAEAQQKLMQPKAEAKAIDPETLEPWPEPPGLSD